MARNAVMKSLFASWCILISFVSQTRVAATCFFPNGASDAGHTPCNTGDGTSICCPDGWQCLSNGLCADPRYANFERLERGACTDQGWGSPCPSFCKDEWARGDAAVQGCSDGTYCCDGHDCCNDSTAQRLTLGPPQITAMAKVGEQAEGGQPAQATSVNVANAQPTSAPAQPTQAQQQQPQQPTQPSAKDEKPPSATTQAVHQGSSLGQQPTATPASAGRSSDSKNPSSTGTAVTSLSPTIYTVISDHTIRVNPTSEPTPSSTSNGQPKRKNNALAIGVGVGVGLAVLLFATLLGIVIYLQLRKRKKERGITELPSGRTSMAQSHPYELEGDLAMEMPAEQLFEMDNKRNSMKELDGCGVEEGVAREKAESKSPLD